MPVSTSPATVPTRWALRVKAQVPLEPDTVPLIDKSSELPETLPVKVALPMANPRAKPAAPCTLAVTLEPSWVTSTVTPVEEVPGSLARIPQSFC